jgi:hypothetical protein
MQQLDIRCQSGKEEEEISGGNITFLLVLTARMGRSCFTTSQFRVNGLSTRAARLERRRRERITMKCIYLSCGKKNPYE